MLIPIFTLGVLLGMWIGVALVQWAQARRRRRIRGETLPSVMIEEGRMVILPEGVPKTFEGLVIECVPRGTVGAVQHDRPLTAADFHAS